MGRLSRGALSGVVTASLVQFGILLAAGTPVLADATAAAGSSTSFFNACATLYNAGKMDEAIAACDKAIAADPNRADAYFVKGSALFGNGTVDKNGKYDVPPGAIEALNKYLELAPNGPHAQDVHAMLDSLK